MITKVQKCLILGIQKEKEAFYKKAQEEGYLEFIKISPLPDQLPKEVQSYLAALKVLRDLPPLPPPSIDSQDLLAAALRVVELKEETERFEEEKRLTQFEMARIAPLGAFSLEDVRAIESTGVKVQFFCGRISPEEVEVVHQHPELVYLTTAHEMDFFLTVSTKTETFSGLVELRIDRSLDELLAHEAFLTETIHSMRQELRAYAGAKDRFREMFLQELDQHNLRQAQEDVYHPLGESSLFAVEAFVPLSKKAKLQELCENLAICCEEIAIEETDVVPTVLENQGTARLGEDLIRVYDCPATEDKDPSSWVFWSFTLFFAMIMADAGYGLLFLLLAGYLKYKYKSFKGSAARIYRTFVVLSLGVVVWGVLTTSFFGMTIGENSLLSRLSPLRYLIEKKADYHLREKDEAYHEWVHAFPGVAKATDVKSFFEATTQPGKKRSAAGETLGNSILLEFSLVVGILHIACSLLRYLKRNWSGIGWILFLIGGYLFFPTIVGVISMVNILSGLDQTVTEPWGEKLLYAGIGIAMLLAFIQNKLSGAKEIMNLIQVFGDVLSYLRLYALGLAGAILASTFNEMGEALGIFFGSFVILAGHALNLSLCVMAGVIHGLRLNFIEWYHYCFVGGGRYFQPLRLQSREE